MTDTADLEIICPGMLAGVLEILSVGKGDIKLTVGGDDPEEIEKAKTIIESMLRAGYAIYVETPKGVRRVKKFSRRHMAYVIAEVAEPEPAGEPARTRKVVERQVPVAGSKAKAVGRTAGG